MSEKPQAIPSQAIYIVITAAIFLVAGLVIATLLNRDSVSQDDLNAAVKEAVSTSVASSASQQDVQALVDSAVSTQIAASAPLVTSGSNTGEAAGLTQGELQALVDQAVGTQVAALRPTVTAVPATPTPIPLEDAAQDDAFLGPADAPVTIIEFADFQCGYCNRWARQVLPEILAKYPNDVKFIYRDFTIFGEDSIRAAMATECAEESGKFWDMHNKIFEGLSEETPIGLDEDSLVNLAGDMDIDKDDFRECLSSQRYINEVGEDYSDAVAWGFGGTPGFIINGVVHTIGAQPFDVFDALIQAELADAS